MLRTCIKQRRSPRTMRIVGSNRNVESEIKLNTESIIMLIWSFLHVFLFSRFPIISFPMWIFSLSLSFSFSPVPFVLSFVDWCDYPSNISLLYALSAPLCYSYTVSLSISSSSFIWFIFILFHLSQNCAAQDLWVAPAIRWVSWPGCFVIISWSSVFGLIDVHMHVHILMSFHDQQQSLYLNWLLD